MSKLPANEIRYQVERWRKRTGLTVVPFLSHEVWVQAVNHVLQPRRMRRAVLSMLALPDAIRNRV